MGSRSVVGWLVAAGVVVAVAIGALAWVVVGPGSGPSAAELRAAAAEWTRTAPVPAEATDVSVESSGGTFSRQVTLRFTASDEVVARWVADSPALAGSGLWEGKRQVEPGGGAALASVTMSAAPTGRTVTLSASWS